MKANVSNRWKNEIVEVVEDHDFEYVDVYDAGRSFRQDNHQCDFCGSHLRYTAVIQAEDDSDLEFSVGLDCLEHAMGTRWSRLQEVERAIKELKEEAARKRRKEAYADEYSGEIDWIERYLEIKYNGFLDDMLHILKTGEREFTRNMEDAVRRIYKNTDLFDLKEEQDEKKQELKGKERRIKKLIKLIAEVDDLELDDDLSLASGSNSTHRFVYSVYTFFNKRGSMSENQLESLNNIYKQYKEKQEETVDA